MFPQGPPGRPMVGIEANLSILRSGHYRREELTLGSTHLRSLKSAVLNLTGFIIDFT